MSILIKGMEMPERCDECNLCDNLGMCIPLGEDLFNYLDKEIAEAEPVRFFPDNWKCSDCPLIELPTPHGRLGDLDELLQDARQLDLETGYEYEEVEEMIKDAPTVIGAEK